MNVKHCLFYSLCFLSIFLFKNDDLCATQYVDQANNIHIDKNDHLYKNVNYNINKYIQIASKKRGENYWAYKAISSGNEWTSSIEALKELLVLAMQVRDAKDGHVDNIFNTMYSQILTALDDVNINKALPVKERLELNNIKNVFAYMNTLMVFATLHHKAKERGLTAQTLYKKAREYFDIIYRKAAFESDEESFEKKIKSKLLEIFDGKEEDLKQYLFHDWQCYLYQFSVIAEGYEYDLAFPYPSSVMSTVLNLGCFCYKSIKIDCAKINIDTPRTVDKLFWSWKKKSTNAKSFFEEMHKIIGKIEEKIDDINPFNISNSTESFYNFYCDNFKISDRDRYYDYDYLLYLSNFIHLTHLQEKYCPNILLQRFTIRECIDLFKYTRKEKLNININSIQALTPIGVFNILVPCLKIFGLKIFENVDFGKICLDDYVLKVRGIIAKLFEIISINNLTNCHDFAFREIFYAINDVGLDETFHLIKCALLNPEVFVIKNDFYSIAKWVSQEASNIKNRKA